jgi:menaquinol-cytochrome c reductase iron-sulfur subunit
VGRVWLVRSGDATEASDAGQVAVQAFNSVCPHMGCQIQAQVSNRGFVCPCHRASFGSDGSRQVDSRSGDQNHAPRDMDSLVCRIVQDPETGDAWVEVKFEKFQLGLESRVVRS